MSVITTLSSSTQISPIQIFYFPEAPAGLLARALPPRKTHRRFLLFNQASAQAVPAAQEGKKKKKEEGGGQAVPVPFRQWKVPAKFRPNTNTGF